ncbi:hypothetical protein O0L34_g18591 [Tuta absoluta]|nr:hypothetical protein O0L34_g18591 [Tuta absoluta]
MCERKFDVSKPNFKQKVCEYVMFMESFSQTVECRGSSPKKRPESTSIKPSHKKIGKETKPTLKKRIKTESLSETDDDDDFVDCEDLSPNGIKEENKLRPKIKQNIDDLLANMEKVAEFSSNDLKKHKKKYPLYKKPFKSKTKREKLSRKAEIESLEQKDKQKPEDLQCKVCSKVLASAHSLKYHMERHTGGSYICEHCGRKFCTKAELQYHLASTHEIGNQFTCKQCGFKAPKRYELMEHERIHTGERPYTCDKCGLTFRRRGVWRKHSLYHMEKTIQCQQCPRKFFVKGELIAHVNGVHQRMYIYACNYCDTTYAKTGTVRRHMIDKHGIAREEQGKIKRINIVKTSNMWHAAGKSEKS